MTLYLTKKIFPENKEFYKEVISLYHEMRSKNIEVLTYLEWLSSNNQTENDFSVWSKNLYNSLSSEEFKTRYFDRKLTQDLDSLMRVWDPFTIKELRESIKDLPNDLSIELYLSGSCDDQYIETEFILKEEIKPHQKQKSALESYRSYINNIEREYEYYLKLGEKFKYAKS